MIEAVMLWNEPNNQSHWDFEIDPGLEASSRSMVKLAADGDPRREPAPDARAGRHLAHRPGVHRAT